MFSNYYAISIFFWVRMCFEQQGVFFMGGICLINVGQADNVHVAFSPHTAA